MNLYRLFNYLNYAFAVFFLYAFFFEGLHTSNLLIAMLIIHNIIDSKTIENLRNKLKNN